MVDYAQGPLDIATKWRPQYGGAVVGGVQAGTGLASNAGQSAPAAVPAESPSPVTLLVGIILLFVVLKLVSESKASELELGHIHVGAWNTMVIILVAVGGIALAKVVLNRWQLPGATTLINFV